MGIYAQTSFTIKCKTNKGAKKIKKLIESLEKDEHGNTFGRDLSLYENEITGFEDSERIQNLEYRMNMLWEKIKDEEEVVEFYAPFMSESDGIHEIKLYD